MWVNENVAWTAKSGGSPPYLITQFLSFLATMRGVYREGGSVHRNLLIQWTETRGVVLQADRLGALRAKLPGVLERFLRDVWGFMT